MVAGVWLRRSPLELPSVNRVRISRLTGRPRLRVMCWIACLCVMSRHCGFNDRLTAVRSGTFVMRWLLIFIFAIALSARAEDPSASTISREVKDIFDRCKKAVVKIHGDDEHSELSGTGFFIDPTG